MTAPAITLVGHPYAPIGMGEQMRSHVAACRAVGLEIGVYDIHRHASRDDPAHCALLDPLERTHVPPGIRIFHVNGDEVPTVLDTFAARGNAFDGSINVVMPAWELPTYPEIWAAQLRRFDEVWAISRFVADGLARAGIASTPIGQSVEMAPGPLLPRRQFGIRESAFVLLHFLDLSSYASRKNPAGVLALFNRLRARDPFIDLQLVLKVKDRNAAARDWAASLTSGPQVLVLPEPLDTMATRSLIRACDCFVSLHRAEGFGRGLGEAMMLARLALGTAWSGNLDFMTPDNSLLAAYALRAVGGEEYPYAQGQEWAEPDIEHAAELLTPALRDPARGRAIALRGQAAVFRTHGHRAVGLRILDRVEALASVRPLTAAPRTRRARAS